MVGSGPREIVGPVYVLFSAKEPQEEPEDSQAAKQPSQLSKPSKGPAKSVKSESKPESTPLLKATTSMPSKGPAKAVKSDSKPAKPPGLIDKWAALSCLTFRHNFYLFFSGTSFPGPRGRFRAPGRGF
jgi:hypothetical protein